MPAPEHAARGRQVNGGVRQCGANGAPVFFAPGAEKNLYTPPGRPYLPLSRKFCGGFCWFEQRLVQPTGGGPMRWKDTQLLLP